jgi:hypothetical protein
MVGRPTGGLAGLDLSVGRRVTSEYWQRTGHRFNMVVGCLPKG